VIDRYCFVRLRDGIDRAEVIARFRETFEGRLDVISATAGVPADDSARSWDLGFVVRCPNLDRTAALLARAAHFFAWLDARALVVKSWSFETA